MNVVLVDSRSAVLSRRETHVQTDADIDINTDIDIDAATDTATDIDTDTYTDVDIDIVTDTDTDIEIYIFTTSSLQPVTTIKKPQHSETGNSQLDIRLYM